MMGINDICNGINNIYSISKVCTKKCFHLSVKLVYVRLFVDTMTKRRPFVVEPVQQDAFWECVLPIAALSIVAALVYSCRKKRTINFGPMFR